MSYFLEDWNFNGTDKEEYINFQTYSMVLISIAFCSTVLVSFPFFVCIMISFILITRSKSRAFLFLNLLYYVESAEHSTVTILYSCCDILQYYWSMLDSVSGAMF